MLCHVVLVITDVLEECRTSIIKVARICELGTMLLITANIVSISLILVTLMMEVLHSSETSVLVGATQHDIPEYGFLDTD
jgi:hypothetical protein